MAPTSRPEKLNSGSSEAVIVPSASASARDSIGLMQRSKCRRSWISTLVKAPDCMTVTAFIGNNALGLAAEEWFHERSHEQQTLRRKVDLKANASSCRGQPAPKTRSLRPHSDISLHSESLRRRCSPPLRVTIKVHIE
jgi:hypothetical protein